MEVDVGGALMRKDEGGMGTIGRRGCGGEEEWNRGWDDSRKEGEEGKKAMWRLGKRKTNTQRIKIDTYREP